MGALGVFVGLCTVDVIHLIDHLPDPDQKVVSPQWCVEAGGPATNAAITFAHLAGSASLVTALGAHPLASLVRTGLGSVVLRDLTPDAPAPPTVASVMVTRATGQRAVISAGSSGRRVDPAGFESAWLDGACVLLVDGHHMPVAQRAAREARARGVPVVFDGGSWKLGTEALLPWVDVAICGERFEPPGGVSGADVPDWLLEAGVGAAAVTRGPRPILYRDASGAGRLEVPRIEAVDTLGAGDVFHGAFCAAWAARRLGFVEALGEAAELAARSCMSLGPRAWMWEVER